MSIDGLMPPDLVKMAVMIGDFSPIEFLRSTRINRSKQDSLIDRTSRPACAFRFDDWGGSLTHFMLALVKNVLKLRGNSGSRSWIR